MPHTAGAWTLPLAIVSILTAAPRGDAQTLTGRLLGAVDGAPLGGARVSLVDSAGTLLSAMMWRRKVARWW